MDAFMQSLAGLASLSIPISFVALLLLYLTIRVAVMHALRDHVKWVEKRGGRG